MQPALDEPFSANQVVFSRSRNCRGHTGLLPRGAVSHPLFFRLALACQVGCRNRGMGVAWGVASGSPEEE